MDKNIENQQKEYSNRGEYHKNLNPKWSYYPTYLAKRKHILGLMKKQDKGLAVLDMGSGEGVFVKELREMGFKNSIGLDISFENEFVKKGDALESPFADNSFDIALLLDVLEHFNFADQTKALEEIGRVLKAGGKLIVSVPNLAHFYSRIRFLLKGEYKRTADIKKHPGDRPIKEYLEIFQQAGFIIEKRVGIFPTFPLCFNIILASPDKTLFLYNFLTKFFALPNICFLNIITLKNGKTN